MIGLPELKGEQPLRQQQFGMAELIRHQHVSTVFNYSQCQMGGAKDLHCRFKPYACKPIYSTYICDHSYTVDSVDAV